MSDNPYIANGMPLAAVNTNAIIMGIALTAAGSVISFCGLAIGATALVSAGRRWMLAQPEPPAAAMKRKIGQASAATAAGARAWQSATTGQPPARKRGPHLTACRLEAGQPVRRHSRRHHPPRVS